VRWPTTAPSVKGSAVRTVPSAATSREVAGAPACQAATSGTAGRPRSAARSRAIAVSPPIVGAAIATHADRDQRQPPPAATAAAVADDHARHDANSAICSGGPRTRARAPTAAAMAGAHGPVTATAVGAAVAR
jgi:hypothetical protein